MYRANKSERIWTLQKFGNLPKRLNSLSNFLNLLEVDIRQVDIYSSALMAYDDAVDVVRYSFLSFYLYFVIATVEHISVLHLLQTLLPLPSIDLDV